MLHVLQVLLGMFAELPKVTVPLSCLSVHMQQLAATRHIFIEFDILEFFENMRRKFKFD
jgi:hypothetical protein